LRKPAKTRAQGGGKGNPSRREEPHPSIFKEERVQRAKSACGLRRHTFIAEKGQKKKDGRAKGKKEVDRCSVSKEGRGEGRLLRRSCMAHTLGKRGEKERKAWVAEGRGLGKGGMLIERQKKTTSRGEKRKAAEKKRARRPMFRGGRDQWGEERAKGMQIRRKEGGRKKPSIQLVGGARNRSGREKMPSARMAEGKEGNSHKEGRKRSFPKGKK